MCDLGWLKVSRFETALDSLRRQVSVVGIPQSSTHANWMGRDGETIWYLRVYKPTQVSLLTPMCLLAHRPQVSRLTI